MKIKIDKDISSEINIARKKLRMSQKMLARKIGISQQTLQRIESGINKTCDKDVLHKSLHLIQQQNLLEYQIHYYIKFIQLRLKRNYLMILKLLFFV